MVQKERPERMKVPSAKRKLARSSAVDEPFQARSKKVKVESVEQGKSEPTRTMPKRNPKPRAADKRKGNEQSLKEKRGVDFMKLDLETLGRYKRFFRVSTVGKSRKAEIVQAIAEHFNNLVVNERDVVEQFWRIVSASQSK
eukprot:c17502_g1_i1.p1 GENE.c17502_g1_i1~~c17502_g1_i1.p1  ORF type:complete len:141 (+),score=22.83 c17502_g1_i1:49-471(+)